MSKKVHFSESQVNEICDKLDEMDLKGSPFMVSTVNSFKKGTPLAQACAATQEIARLNPNGGATLDGVQADVTKNPNDMAHDIQNRAQKVSDGVIGESYTKKQLKEAKLRYLKEHSDSYSKKDFKSKFINQ